VDDANEAKRLHPVQWRGKSATSRQIPVRIIRANDTFLLCVLVSAADINIFVLNREHLPDKIHHFVGQETVNNFGWALHAKQ